MIESGSSKVEIFSSTPPSIFQINRNEHKKLKCARCDSEKIMMVSAKCSDLCSVELDGEREDGYVPRGINCGDDGDYVTIFVCGHCGQMMGKWPLPEGIIPSRKEEDEEGEDEDDEEEDENKSVLCLVYGNLDLEKFAKLIDGLYLNGTIIYRRNNKAIMIEKDKKMDATKAKFIIEYLCGHGAPGKGQCVLSGDIAKNFNPSPTLTNGKHIDWNSYFYNRDELGGKARIVQIIADNRENLLPFFAETFVQFVDQVLSEFL